MFQRIAVVSIRENLITQMQVNCRYDAELYFLTSWQCGDIALPSK